VCRFYGSITPGPNSHFFTADPDECAAVKNDPGWHYEGIAFYVTLANDGDCAADRVAVWRAYNNGFKPQQGINDGNHRFATDHALTRRLADFGWNDEGIVFCALATTPFVPYVFGISRAPVLLVPGAARSVFFSLDARNGFTGEVTLAAIGLPAGVTAQFVPPTVTLGTKPGSVALRLTAAATTPLTAEYTNVTISGTAAGGNAFTGFVLGVAAANDPIAEQALAVAAVEEKGRALRADGLKGLPYIQGIATFMGTHPAYTSTGIDAETIGAWGWFKDGTLHVVTDNLERPKSNYQASDEIESVARRVEAKAGGEIPGVTKARLSQVFGPGFVGERPIKDMRRFLRSKGWSLRPGSDGFVSSLRAVQGDGFFYLNSHGTVINAQAPNEPAGGMHLVWSETLVDDNYDRLYTTDRLTLRLIKYQARNFLEPDGAEPLEDTRYAFTYRFVDAYMQFEDSSVVFMNACWSGQATNPATTKFINAFNNKGAGVYLGWSHLLDFDTAFLAAPWFVDRMVGANLHYDKESPPQRAFTYDLVLKDMARKGIDASLTTPAKLLPWPKAGLKNPPILAPSIRFARVNEYDEELVLTGEFGERPPKVTVGGTPLTIKSNTASEIKAVLPLAGPGANGDVVVEVRNVKSNARQLSEWWVEFSYNWLDVADIPDLIMQGATVLRFRADAGRYRLKPHETPHFPSLGGPPTKDSALLLNAHGTHSDGDCTSTLSGSATYPTPASPASQNGLVLASFLKLDGQTKAGAIGLSFGALASPHTITVVCPKSSGTFGIPPFVGLLEGPADFPNAQSDNPVLVQLPAMNFTFDANWGIPDKIKAELEAGGLIEIKWPPAPAISPPRDTRDSGK
jgi:hypothetical protein